MRVTRSLESHRLANTALSALECPLLARALPLLRPSSTEGVGVYFWSEFAAEQLQRGDTLFYIR